MVVPEPEMVSQGEVESQLRSDQQAKNNYPFSGVGRQSSIYSLTLDEFQHTLCESGRNFGSMNMDEFLTSIWNAEGNQAMNSSHNYNNGDSNGGMHVSLIESSAEKGITKQPSLPCQGSLTIPAPLCMKTVDEVWSEIHKGQQHQRRNNNSNNENAQNSEPAQRQHTFGEMTLEDFLVKAGVVRGQGRPSPMAATPQQRHYELYPKTPSVGPSFRPTVGVTGGVVGGESIDGGRGNVSTVAAPFQSVLSQAGGAIGEAAGYAGNGKIDGGYQQLPLPPGVCYGGRLVNGGGGYVVAPPTIGMPAPVSPVSPDRMCSNQVDSTGSQYGMDMNTLRGRKRILDGPVERVVERRQRRMIKNRESAARSRARKQAYTVELEAELNQLREENSQLKQALAEFDQRKSNQQVIHNSSPRPGQQHGEEEKMKVPNKAQKTREKLRNLRRNLSCPILKELWIAEALM